MNRRKESLIQKPTEKWPLSNGEKHSLKYVNFDGLFDRKTFDMNHRL